MRFFAPAKINLFLHIVGKRPDGYHNLETVFLLLDLMDEITIDSNTDGVISRTGDLVGDIQNDLCLKAAYKLKEISGTPFGAAINVKKHIPSGAGLGGGSSDAATTLLALNDLWKLHLNTENLMRVAATLGADVPFFIFGKTAFAEGIGEKLTPVNLPPAFVLISKPQEAIATKDIYSDITLKRNCTPLNLNDFIAKQQELWPLLAQDNVMQEIVSKKLDSVKKTLSALGPHAQMTGSGSAVFKLFTTKKDALLTLKSAPLSNFNYVGEILSHHPYQKTSLLG